MDLSFLINKAQERKNKIDEDYGAYAFGGSKYQAPEKPENLYKIGGTQDKSGTVSATKSSVSQAAEVKRPQPFTPTKIELPTVAKIKQNDPFKRVNNPISMEDFKERSTLLSGQIDAQKAKLEMNNNPKWLASEQGKAETQKLKSLTNALKQSQDRYNYLREKEASDRLIRERTEFETAVRNKDFGKYVSQAKYKANPKYDAIRSIYDGSRMFDTDLAGHEISTQTNKVKLLEEYGDKIAIDKVFSNYDYDALRYMTEKEKNVYNYYFAKEGSSKAEQYLLTLQRALNERRAKKTSAEQMAYAQQNPFKATGLALANSIGAVGATVEAGKQALANAVTGEYNPIDPNALLMKNARASQTYQQGAADKLSQVVYDKTGNEKLAKYTPAALSIGNSIIQSLTVAGGATLLSGGNPVAGLAALGSSAGGMSTLNAADRGATPGQALAVGVVDGVVEAAAEYLPTMSLIENLGKGAIGTKAFTQRLAKQFATEFGEESATQLANNVNDIIVMGDKSNYERYKKDLINSGYKDSDAANIAFRQFFIDEVIEAGIAGGIAGGVTGSVSLGIGNVRADSVGKMLRTTSTGAETGIVNSIMRDARQSENANVRKLASAIDASVEDGGMMRDADLGHLYLTMMESKAENNIQKSETDETISNESEPQDVVMPEGNESRQGVVVADNVMSAIMDNGASAKDAQMLSQAINKVLSGENISNADANKIINFDNAKKVYQQITGEQLSSVKSEARAQIRSYAELMKQQNAVKETSTVIAEAQSVETEVAEQSANEIMNSIENEVKVATVDAVQKDTETERYQLKDTTTNETQEQPKLRVMSPDNYEKFYRDNIDANASYELIMVEYQKYLAQQGLTQAESKTTIPIMSRENTPSVTKATVDTSRTTGLESAPTNQVETDIPAINDIVTEPENTRLKESTTTSKPVKQPTNNRRTTETEIVDIRQKRKDNIEVHQFALRAKKRLAKYGIKDVVVTYDALSNDQLGKFAVDDGKIYLNGNNLTNAMYAANTLAHELTHPAMDGDSTLTQDILDAWSAIESGKDNSYSLNDALEEYKQRYKNWYAKKGKNTDTVTDKFIREEFAADRMADWLMSADMMERFAPTLTQKIIAKLEYLKANTEDKADIREYNNTIKRLRNGLEQWNNSLNINDSTKERQQLNGLNNRDNKFIERAINKSNRKLDKITQTVSESQARLTAIDTNKVEQAKIQKPENIQPTVEQLEKTRQDTAKIKSEMREVKNTLSEIKAADKVKTQQLKLAEKKAAETLSKATRLRKLDAQRAMKFKHWYDKTINSPVADLNAKVDTLHKFDKPVEPTNAFKTAQQVLADKAENVLKKELGASYRRWINSAQTIDNFSKLQTTEDQYKVSNLVNIARGSGATVEHIFSYGLVGKDGSIIDSRNFADMVLMRNEKGKIDNELTKKFNDYLLNKHGIDRMNIEGTNLRLLREYEAAHPGIADLTKEQLGMYATMTVNESANGTYKFTKDEVKEYVRLMEKFAKEKNTPLFSDSEGNAVTSETHRMIAEQYEKAYPEFKQRGQDLYKWWDKFMNEWAVGTLMSKEQYTSLREKYPSYVPTYRVRPDGTLAGSVGFVGAHHASVDSVIKKAKGSFREIVPVEDSMASVINKIVKQQRINQMYLSIIGSSERDGKRFRDYALFDAFNQEQVNDADLDTQVEEFSKRKGLEEMGNGVYRINAWDNGQMKSAYVAEDLFKSIHDTVGNSYSETDRASIRVGRKLTAPMKTAITGINPFFAVRNVMRDFPSAIVNTRNNAVKFAAYYLPMAVRKILFQHSDWTTYKALGGKSTGYYNEVYGIQHHLDERASMLKKTGKVIGRGLTTLGDFSESITRFAEYLATLDRVGDTESGRYQAIKDAAEVTLDFGRNGTTGKIANAWIPYFNPALQGIDKMFRNLGSQEHGARNKLKVAGKTLTRAMFTSVLPELLLLYAIKGSDDEDDYKALNDRTKDAYYCIPIGGGKFFKVPKNREWGAILGIFTSRKLQESLLGKENAMDGYLETVVANFMPSGILDIPLVSQYVAIQKNETFSGAPIVSPAVADGSKEYQYDEYTSAWAKYLGSLDTIPLSPMQLDYVLESYFGDLAEFANDLSANGMEFVDFEDRLLYAATGFKSQFIADTAYSNQTMTEYYDLKEEVVRTATDKRNMDPDNYEGSVEQDLNSIFTKYSKSISDLSKASRELNTQTGMSHDERIAKQRELKFQAAELASQAIDIYKDVQSGKLKDPKRTLSYRELGLSDPVTKEIIAMEDNFDSESLKTTQNFKPLQSAPQSVVSASNSSFKYTEKTDEYFALYNSLYDEGILQLINSAEYKSASTEQKALMLSEEKKHITDLAQQKFESMMNQQGIQPLLNSPYTIDKTVESELIKYQKYLKDYSVLPTPVQSSFVDQEHKTGVKGYNYTYNLTAAQKEEYAELYQSLYNKSFKALIASAKYKKSGNRARLELLSKLRTEVNKEAKVQMGRKLLKQGVKPTKTKT